MTTYYLKYYFALFLRRRHVTVKEGRLMETQDTLQSGFEAALRDRVIL